MLYQITHNELDRVNVSDPIQRQELINSIVEAMDGLHRYAMVLTRNRSDADDLLQETLIKAIQHLHQFRCGTRPEPWLTRIMKNTFLNDIRKHRTASRIVDTVWGDDDSVPSVPEPPRDRFLAEKLEEALEQVPLEFRKCILLCDLSEFSYREAANTLEIPIGTVMSRLHRGRKLMRHLLGLASIEDLPTANMLAAVPC